MMCILVTASVTGVLGAILAFVIYDKATYVPPQLYDKNGWPVNGG